MSAIKWVGFKLGMFGVLLDTFMDIVDISKDDRLNDVQKYFSIMVIGLTALLMILSIYAVVMSTFGPFAGLAILTLLLFLYNALEEFALEAIRSPIPE